MKFEVILTAQDVYEVEAPTPEVTLAVVTGDGRAAGDILAHRRDLALPEISPLPKTWDAHALLYPGRMEETA
mgnify:CR=1 FL=1